MSDETAQQPFMQEIKMGVGDAIKRLTAVEFRVRQGLSAIPERELQERDMITNALNQYQLHLGFDCTGDGVPDDVSIFEHSAATSCCRLLPEGKVPTDTSRKGSGKKQGSSTSRSPRKLFGKKEKK